MRRAKLVTDEILQWAQFNTAAREIDAAIWRGSSQSAKRRIKMLMKDLLQKRSEATIELFVEMHRRWKYVAEILKYLEANWTDWVTWEDRIELLWYTFGTREANVDLIQAAYSLMEMIDPHNCNLVDKERLRGLVRTITEFQKDVRLRSELLKVVDLRYSTVMNVRQYVNNLFESRHAANRPSTQPLPKEQIRELLTRNAR